jgi:hypothetical protein
VTYRHKQQKENGPFPGHVVIKEVVQAMEKEEYGFSSIERKSLHLFPGGHMAPWVKMMLNK